MKQLRNYQGINTKQLHNNMGKLWAIERGLQLSIQIILDIGNHILADKGITVENYADIFQELINQEIIPEQYGKKIIVEGSKYIKNERMKIKEVDISMHT